MTILMLFHNRLHYIGNKHHDMLLVMCMKMTRNFQLKRTMIRKYYSLIKKTRKVPTLETNIRTINMSTILKNQQIKSTLIIETMLKHHHTLTRNYTRRTSSTLWKI